MNKTKFCIFMLLTACCLVFFGTALADQVGNKRWCNSDQYGCWVTGSGGGQNYIMFWDESARDLFMGKDSKAPVVKRYPAGELALNPAPPPVPVLTPAPAKPEEAEKELTIDEKFKAIQTYMTKNGDPWFPSDFIEMFSQLSVNVNIEGDFNDMVINVYALVNEDNPDKNSNIFAYLSDYMPEIERPQ